MRRTFYVNVSVANVYREATYHSEIDTQVTLWEQLSELEQKGDFVKILASDGYTGWVSRYQIIQAGEEEPDLKMVTGQFNNIYSEAAADSEIIGQVVCGSLIRLEGKTDSWIQIALPDKRKGWLQKTAFSVLPKTGRSELVDFSRRYLGIPYFWGGKTPKGFDCSGFVQLVFKLFGFSLRRDTWMQHEDGDFVSSNPQQVQPGDLMFFAEGGQRITHVAIAAGQSKFIHAKGFVRINSLDPDDTLFDPALLETFVDARTFF